MDEEGFSSRNAEIDHRVRQTFQGVMQLTNPFKAQQASKLILPSEDSLDGVKPFLKDGRSELAYVHAWESFCRADFLEYSVPSRD